MKKYHILQAKPKHYMQNQVLMIVGKYFLREAILKYSRCSLCPNSSYPQPGHFSLQRHREHREKKIRNRGLVRKITQFIYRNSLHLCVPVVKNALAVDKNCLILLYLRKRFLFPSGRNDLLRCQGKYHMTCSTI
jgi:hypothetical protein